MLPADHAELTDADLEGVVGGKGRKSASGSSPRASDPDEKKSGDGPRPDPKLERFFDRQNQN